MLKKQLKKSLKYLTFTLIIILFILIIINNNFEKTSYITVINSLLFSAFCSYLFIYIHYLYIKQLEQQKGIFLIVSPTLIKAIILFLSAYICYILSFLNIRYYIFGILAYPFHFLFLIITDSIRNKVAIKFKEKN